MILIPIVAAVLYGVALAHYKWAISRTALETKTFLSVHFVILFLVALAAALMWGDFSVPIFTDGRYIVLLAVMIIFGLVHNYFLARGLKRESLHEYELIDLLVPVFTVLLAAFAFVDERDPVRLLLAIFGTSVFLVTHIKHHHLQFKQADRWLVYAVFLMAMERILVKPLLTLADPVFLYAIRTGWIALFLFLVFRPRLRTIALFEWWQLLINGVLGVAAMILIWTSIGYFGVVVTELYLLLTPITIAVISLVFFKERWTLTQVTAFGVILLCVALVNLSEWLPKMVST